MKSLEVQNQKKLEYSNSIFTTSFVMIKIPFNYNYFIHGKKSGVYRISKTILYIREARLFFQVGSRKENIVKKQIVITNIVSKLVKYLLPQNRVFKLGKSKKQRNKQKNLLMEPISNYLNWCLSLVFF
eukprot:TRINITY_DN22216_c0_g1_i15.p4 TRINITY_DN22216_c0_g1~~TRINITY_DN22216_c0_g1_i15.p4  ORF type:complete len:128 (+),score=2.71 TRINITY_DN22216_c0_g1_i15:519-902(+)